MANTAVISFRINKAVRSWTVYAAGGFRSEGELLTLILERAVHNQAGSRGLGGFLSGLLGNPHHQPIGDSVVLGVRLPVEKVAAIREAAASKGKTVSEWAGLVVFDFYQSFSKEYEQYKDDTGWLARYATELKIASIKE